MPSSGPRTADDEIRPGTVPRSAPGALPLGAAEDRDAAQARTAPILLTTAPGGDPYHHGCVRPRARVRGLGAR
ncbi:hypothetical protein [Streptomyces uncialis]|uniref:Uncharacterized protein n=1 Tax=Streptomyces uncialis TaxID=1048205 RepID=A0A1Q4UYK0_9ACTN|nr:hypothetical protein [Streptomyces uncialis]OKH90680.1 hypothetical protein AB852_34290 [Streptomyces uncialis]